jgi:hypothetical protein
VPALDRLTGESNRSRRERRHCVSARRKLNAANINGLLLIAGVVGVATGSVTTAVVVAGALIVTGLIAGTIRPGPGRRK